MNSHIGIIGGGQLGRMLGIAAKRLGYVVTVIDPHELGPTAQVVDHHLQFPIDDAKALAKLDAIADFLTVELEAVDTQQLEKFRSAGSIVHPLPKTVEIIRNKFEQKKFFAQHDIAVASFTEAQNPDDLPKIAQKFGYPFLLKAAVGAYDGKGNAVVSSEADFEGALKTLGDRQLYAEKFVPFTKELAVMVARSSTREVRTYPVVETVHVNNICHTVSAPARVSEAVQETALTLARQVVTLLDGVGVFGVEMFLLEDGSVMVNEVAPRVHNSGHYTLEACVTDQFEQHIRAITGLPLGATDLLTPAACMVNILGEHEQPARVTGLETALGIPQVAVHIYGKADTRTERKMGHITALGSSFEEALERAQQARKAITI